jgi:hypothetical protein
MRDNGEELVHARPRNCPRGPALGERPQPLGGAVVPLRVAAVSVHQNVRADGDHVPRPSYAAALGSVHDAAGRPFPFHASGWRTGMVICVARALDAGDQINPPQASSIS